MRFSGDVEKDADRLSEKKLIKLIGDSKMLVCVCSTPLPGVCCGADPHDTAGFKAGHIKEPVSSPLHLKYTLHKRRLVAGFQGEGLLLVDCCF